MDIWGVLICALIAAIVLWAGVIDPLRRIRARRARKQGRPFDPDLIGPPPPLPDSGGVDQSGSLGCLLMLAAPIALFMFEEPYNWIAATGIVAVLALWLVAITGPRES